MNLESLEISSFFSLCHIQSWSWVESVLLAQAVETAWHCYDVHASHGNTMCFVCTCHGGRDQHISIHITYPLHFFQGGHKLDGVWHSGLRVFGKEFWSCPELFLDGDALHRVTHHGPPPFMRLVLVHVCPCQTEHRLKAPFSSKVGISNCVISFPKLGCQNISEASIIGFAMFIPCFTPTKIGVPLTHPS